MERLYQLLIKFHQSSGFKIQWSPSSQPKLFQLRVPFHFGCQLNAFGASIINKQGVMVPKPKVQNLKSYLRGGISPRFHTRRGVLGLDGRNRSPFGYCFFKIISHVSHSTR